MNSDIVKDIKTFYRIIGGLDEVSERGINVYGENFEDLEDHIDYLKKLCEKYDIEYGYESCVDNEILMENDTYLKIEGLIDEKFTEIMESV